MGRLRKPDPYRECAKCGKQLERKRFLEGCLVWLEDKEAEAVERERKGAGRG